MGLLFSLTSTCLSTTLVPCSTAATTIRRLFSVCLEAPRMSLPIHSFTTLLADLGTLTLGHASLPGRPDSRFLLASEPTELQARAFELLGMDPDRDAYINVTA